MAIKKTQGDLGEAIIMAEAVKRGYKVAIPMGEDWRYDLIVVRNNKLERVQCKYTKSNGRVVTARCCSFNNWNTVRYGSSDIDWLAVYDQTTNQCYFIPAGLLGEKGRTTISLRLAPTKNKQHKKILWAKDYTKW